MVRKVLVQDDGTGHQAFVESPVLTGTQTTSRTIYVGDEDPIVDFAADVIAGDLWVDTTGGQPFQFKARNSADTVWELAPLVSKDGSGNIIGRIEVSASGISAWAFEADGSVRATLELSNGGALQMSTRDAAGTVVTEITMDEFGVAIGRPGAPADLVEGSMLDSNPLGYRATDVGALGLTVSDPPTQAEVQAIADKVDLIRTNLRASGEMA